MTVIHLRDQEGLPPPHKEYPGATHEIDFYAVMDELDIDAWDNEEHRQIAVAEGHHVQFRADDEIARVIVGSTAMMICWGWSPMDNVPRWQAAILAMVERERTGGLSMDIARE
jgi:hypothetical protein